VKRLGFLALAVTAACAGLASPATAATIRITEANGGSFPARAYVLTLPSTTSLSASQVHVNENGGPVGSKELIPATSGGPAHFGVVLVIDASKSMAGKPIEGAMAAARAFAAQRAASQGLALVTFNNRVDVRLPLTRSNVAIGKALDKAPPVAWGTHTYDAVATGIQLLRNAKVDSGSIILLSDGQAVGGTTSLRGAVHKAQADDVRVFTVALRSPLYRPLPLKRLADTTGGAFASASHPSQLASLFNSLGVQLASEYLLKYQSLAGPQDVVHVAVSVDGIHGTARASYQTPALPTPAATPPYHASLFDRVIRSPITAGIVIVLCAALVGVAVAALLRPRRSGVQRRLSEFVTLASAHEAQADAATPGGRRSLFLEDAERTLGSSAWWTRFQEELEIAQVPTPAVQILAATIAGTIATFVVIFLISGSIAFSFLAILIPFLVRGHYKRKLRARRQAFSAQLPDALQIIASALRAGHGLAGALAVVVESADEPMKTELGRAIAAEQLGSPLDEALTVTVNRMKNRDLEQLAFIARLQRETGVSAAEVIDRVTETVRERFELRRLVSTLTAQGRLSRWIVSLLPLALLILILIINPSYLHPLFSHTLGRILLVAGSLLVVGGSIVIGRIVDIEA